MLVTDSIQAGQVICDWAAIKSGECVSKLQTWLMTPASSDNSNNCLTSVVLVMFDLSINTWLEDLITLVIKYILHSSGSPNKYTKCVCSSNSSSSYKLFSKAVV